MQKMKETTKQMRRGKVRSLQRSLGRNSPKTMGLENWKENSRERSSRRYWGLKRSNSKDLVRSLGRKTRKMIQTKTGKVKN